jgi:mRNA interferase MazF
MSTKRRPAVVVSSDIYHANRPDLILAVVTSNVAASTSPTDCLIQDWQSAGLKQPSAFRAYLMMTMPSDVRVIGHLSDRDWTSVRERLKVALG